MVAGLGFRTGVDADALLAAVHAALEAHAVPATALDCLAVLPRKSAEPALAEAARRLAVPLVVADETSLGAVQGRILARSERSIAATGFGSAAEAAALAVAGSSARLLGPRLIRGSVTCAIAQTGEPS